MAKRNVLRSVPASGKKANRSSTKAGTRASSLNYEFKRDVIGRASALAHDTRDKRFSEVKTICNYLENERHLNSIWSFDAKKGDDPDRHLKALVNWLQNEAVSSKTGGRYDVSTIYDMVGTARWMIARIRGIDQNDVIKHGDLGVFKTRAAIQNPIDFSKVSNYEANRAILQQAYMEKATWLGLADRLGMAYGLRAAERIFTKGDIIEKVGKDSYKVIFANGKSRDFTKKQLGRYYGNSSYTTNASKLATGKQYLVVQNTKGDFGRYSEAYSNERKAALDTFRAHIKANPTSHGGIVPDKFGVGQKLTTKQQADSFWHDKTKYIRGKLDEMYNIKNYAYTSNGDRHYDVQRQVLEGRPDNVIISDKGHIDSDKLDFYRPKPK